MKPLVNATFKMKFRRPEATAIRSRIKTIAFKYVVCDLPFRLVRSYTV